VFLKSWELLTQQHSVTTQNLECSTAIRIKIIENE